MSSGTPYRMRGWGKLSGPGNRHGIVVLERAYIVENSARGFFALDAVTGWYGSLGFPFRIAEIDVEWFRRRRVSSKKRTIDPLTTAYICRLWSAADTTIEGIMTQSSEPEIQEQLDLLIARLDEAIETSPNSRELGKQAVEIYTSLNKIKRRFDAGETNLDLDKMRNLAQRLYNEAFGVEDKP